MASSYSDNQLTRIPLPGTFLALLLWLFLAACQFQGRPLEPSVAQLDCEDWNTDEFFEKAKVRDVRRCLMVGADANVTDEYNVTPLHRTVSAEVMGIVLIGADVYASPESFYADISPLPWAGNVEVAAALLDAGADVNARDQSGHTPIFAARSAGVVDLLLDAGATVNVAGDRGRTPLHTASLSRHVVVMNRLIESGADVNVQDEVGHTPLHLACSGSPMIVVTMTGSEWSPETARLAKLGAVGILLDAGALPDVPTKTGETPLHAAALTSREHALRLLLAAGADVGARNRFGVTPLHNAVVFPRYGAESVAALLRAGADVDAVDQSGRTPMTMALKTRDYIHERAERSEELLQTIDAVIVLLREAGASD